MSAPVAAIHSVVKAGGPHGPGHEKHEHQTSQRQMVSPEELSRITEVFRQFEAGQDQGVMDPKDLSTAMKQLGLNPTESEIQDLINEVEHEGLISFQAFGNVVVRKMREDDEENFHKELFRSIHREMLSIDQFKTIMTQLPEKVSEKMAEEMFAEADRDCNGRISFGEFQRMCVVSRSEPIPEMMPELPEEEEDQSNFSFFNNK